MSSSYSLTDLDTRDSEVVCEAVQETASILYGDAVAAEEVAQLFADVRDMFEGRFVYFQSMDVAYHNFEHTLQTVLCWSRILRGYQRHGVARGCVPVDAESFRIGLAAVLLHDIGYLKEDDDAFGSGAKFTYIHEQRSCEMAQIHLGRRNWTLGQVLGVQNIISCTGPHSSMDMIRFRKQEEKVLGQMMCTADYLGQMSDPAYLDKLPGLFAEFEESDLYRGLPPERRRYQTFDELLRRTPEFWAEEVLPRLEGECGGIYRYLAEPYPHGTNPYIESVERNLARVRARLAANVEDAVGA